MSTPVHCCFANPDLANCPAPAAWRLTYGVGLDDYTESCAEHAGALLGDAPLLDVQAISGVPMTAPEPRTWEAGDVVVGTFADGEQVRGLVVGTDPERLHVAWVDGHEERLPDALRVAELRALRVIDRRTQEPDAGTRVHVEAVVADLLTAGTPGHVGLVLDPGQCAGLAGFLQDLCDMHDEQAIDLALWPTAGEFARRYLFEVDENGAPL